MKNMLNFFAQKINDIFSRQEPAGLLKVDEKITDSNLLIICGCKRSGTTVLVRGIRKSGNPGFTQEWALFRAIETDNPVEFKIKIHEILSSAVKRIKSAKNAADYQKVLLKWDEIEKSFDFYSKKNSRNLWKKYLVELVYSQIMDGGKIWGDKFPEYTPFIKGIKAIWPNCKVIYAYRDGRDVAASIKRLGMPNNPFEEWTDDLDKWELWKDKIKHFKIKQEELLKHPKKIAGHLSKYLGTHIDHRHFINFIRWGKEKDNPLSATEQRLNHAGYWVNYFKIDDFPEKNLFWLYKLDYITEKELKNALNCRTSVDDGFLYIFIHVHKCAGSTIREDICKNLKNEEVLRLYYYDNVHNFEKERPFYIDKYIEKIPKERKEKIKVIIGHGAYFGVHKHFNKIPRYVTFLRNPVDRIISQYNYNIDVARENKNINFAKNVLSKNEEKTFEEWFKSTPRQYNYMSKFLMERFFDINLFDKEKIGYFNFLRVKSMLKKFYFIGITENFNADAAVFYNLIGIKRIVKNQNISVRHFTAEGNEKLKKNILKKNQEDIKLYSYAVKLNNKIKKSYF